MAYQNRLADAAEEIERAQEAVAAAQARYSHGGSPEPVNAANRALADAHFKYQQVTGGNAPRDDR